MSFFFSPVELTRGVSVVLEGDAAHHIGTVRRIRQGEEIQLQDPRERRFLVRVDVASKRSVTITPLSELSVPAAPAHSVILLQALVSEQNIDLILQKATELGTKKIVLFQGERSPHTIPADRLSHKLARWIDISRNACEQSGRPTLPTLHVVSSLREALIHAEGVLVALDESGGAFPSADKVTLAVGPEGGLSEQEFSLLKNQSGVFAQIGAYTLRSETAAIAGLAVTHHLS